LRDLESGPSNAETNQIEQKRGGAEAKTKKEGGTSLARERKELDAMREDQRKHGGGG